MQSRGDYRRTLGDAGLALAEGQVVGHIIAHTHGGANHPHNFFPISAAYNEDTLQNYDHINAYLAGVEKTTQAVLMSWSLGNMSRTVMPGHQDYKRFRPSTNLPSESEARSKANGLYTLGESAMRTAFSAMKRYEH